MCKAVWLALLVWNICHRPVPILLAFYHRQGLFCLLVLTDSGLFCLIFVIGSGIFCLLVTISNCKKFLKCVEHTSPPSFCPYRIHYPRIKEEFAILFSYFVRSMQSTPWVVAGLLMLEVYTQASEPLRPWICRIKRKLLITFRFKYERIVLKFRENILEISREYSWDSQRRILWFQRRIMRFPDNNLSEEPSFWIPWPRNWIRCWNGFVSG